MERKKAAEQARTIRSKEELRAMATERRHRRRLKAENKANCSGPQRQVEKGNLLSFGPIEVTKKNM